MFNLKNFVALASALFISNVSAQPLNNRPVVGILTLPCEGDKWCGSNTQYFPASYSKSFEAAGARVIPLQYTWSKEELQGALALINAAFFTGGSADLNDGSQYFSAVQTIYDFTLDANSKGDYFPLIGTCLGFESIVRVVSGDQDILDTFDAENITLPLSFTPEAQTSRIFDPSTGGSWATDAYNNFASFNITMNNHMMGVTPDAFKASSLLSSTFTILSTNVDRNGKEFVSMIEGKSLPIFAQQFHPEKNMFEWTPKEVIQHTYSSIVASSYLINFFTRQARLNEHTYTSSKTSLYQQIDSYQATFLDGEFVSVYLFP